MFTYLIEMLSADTVLPEEETVDKSVDVDRLVERAKSGDTDAFSEIVVCYEKFVYNTACRVLTASGRSVTDADDIAQDALIKAWRSLSSFRGDCSFSTDAGAEGCVQAAEKRRGTLSGAVRAVR